MLNVLFNYPQKELVELGVTPKGLILLEYLKIKAREDWREINGYIYYRLDYLKIAEHLPILDIDSENEVDLLVHQLMNSRLISVVRSNESGLMRRYYRMGVNYDLLI